MILDIDQYRPISLLARSLSCSEKTVRNDIARINRTLEKHSLASRVEGKRGSGVRFDLHSGERPRIDYLVAEDKSHAELKVERFCRGVLLIGMHPTGYSTDALAQMLYTNVKRLREELSFWRSILNLYGADIARSAGTLRLTGKEWAIRYALMLGVYTMAPTPLQHALESELLFDDHAFFEASVRRIEHILHSRLSSNARRQLIAYLALSVKRVSQGFIIDGFDLPNMAIAPALIAEKARIERHFHLALPEGEALFLSASLPCYACQWDEQLVAACVASPEARSLTRVLTSALAARFGIPVPHSLEKPVEILMDTSLSHRLFPHMPLPNPNEQLMKFEYMDKYLIIQEVFLDDGSLEAMRLAGSDCARFTMLLIDYLEEVALPRCFRVGLVVSAGIEQSIFSVHRLKKLMPSVDVVAILGEDDALKLDSRQRLTDQCLSFDFLISFEPLDIAVPCVNISASLNAQDLERIMQTANSIENSRLLLGGTLEVIEHAIAPVSTWDDIVESVHEHLMAQHCFQGGRADLSLLFEQHAVHAGDVVVLGVHGRCATRSVALFYALEGGFADVSEHAGKSFSRIACLLVPPDERHRLPLMVECFKRLLGTPPDAAH